MLREKRGSLHGESFPSTSPWNSDLTPGTILCTITGDICPSACSYYLNMFAALTNRQRWQLWITFKKHKRINLFLPCRSKSTTAFETNTNTKHLPKRKTIMAFYAVETFQQFRILARLESVPFVLRTAWVIKKDFRCIYHAELSEISSELLKYVKTDWSLHPCLVCVRAIHTCIILHSLAFVSRSLITRVLISGEMHASLTRCVQHLLLLQGDSSIIYCSLFQTRIMQYIGCGFVSQSCVL